MKPRLGLERKRRGDAGPWKTRETKTRFPFVSPSPWKSLHDSHIPITPTIVRSHQKPKKGTQQLSSICLHHFRPVLRLENAPVAARIDGLTDLIQAIVKIVGPPVRA